MLGAHVSLKPVLISEYSDNFEMLVVEIKASNKSIRVITGYGPQENVSTEERMPFFARNCQCKIVKQVNCDTNGRQQQNWYGNGA